MRPQSEEHVLYILWETSFSDLYGSPPESLADLAGGVPIESQQPLSHGGGSTCFRMYDQYGQRARTVYGTDWSSLTPQVFMVQSIKSSFNPWLPG